MNYISLGYFCSIASELEKCGLREMSSPFDWNISNFEGVISAIDNNFEGFLEYEQLSQNKHNRNYYKNIKYNIEFYHDFDAYTPLAKQLPKVVKKYKKRIERFYNAIREKTLFIRYISDEQKTNGVSNELLWIEKNYSYILNTLRKYNKDNNILFIANNGTTSDYIYIYNVTKPINDTVNRNPFSANPKIKEALFERADDINQSNVQKNIERYKKKNKFPFYRKIGNRAKNIIRRLLKPEYIHDVEH